MSHTKKAWPLLHADGSITTEIVHSVRVPEGTVSVTPSLRGAMRGTVRSFLATFAIRTTADYGFDEDSVRGVDWASNSSCPAGNTPGDCRSAACHGHDWTLGVPSRRDPLRERQEQR